MEAVGRKSARKGGGKVGSGSNKKKQQQAQSLPKAAISRQENRKRVFEERQKEKDDQEKLEQVGGQAWSLSMEKVKALAYGGLEEEQTATPEAFLSVFGESIQDVPGMTGDDDPWVKWQAALAEPLVITEAEIKESNEEWEMSMPARLRGEDEDLSDEDDEARRASLFRADWEFLWSDDYGAFEDNTRIPPMRFTYIKPPQDAMHENALQIFSAKVTATRGGGMPFDVYGMVAIRDSIDHNRNIAFRRTRDNCQTLTKEHPYLVLTGPTRAVMLEMSTLVIIEVDLTLKGTTESDDEKLSSLAVPMLSSNTRYSHMWKCAYTSKLSTVEFTLGHIVSSVEATIFVRITRGSWLDGFRVRFSAIASGGVKVPASTVHSSVNDEEITLLDSGGDKVPATSDGDIKLSRRVVSVDTTGELKVKVEAWEGDNSLWKWESFKPLDAGKGNGTIDMGFITMDVTVFWSLISYHPVYAKTAL